MTYASLPRTSYAEAPEENRIDDTAFAVDALRLAGRAMRARMAPVDPRDRAIEIIQARLTAVLEAVGAQLDAVESIRAHLTLLEPAEPAPKIAAPAFEDVTPFVHLPPHWRSRGPRPVNYTAFARRRPR